MKTTRDIPRDNFTPALEATGSLLAKELNEICSGGWTDALTAHFAIEAAPINGKAATFYRHLGPLRANVVLVLAQNYRRYFKLALAHPYQTERDPHEWALGQLQPALVAVLEWSLGWYILACDGARPIASIERIPGQTVSVPIPTTVPPVSPPEPWRAPAWLFEVGAFVGIGPLKTEHVPTRDSEEKLGAGHTRLLLKGARRVFLWQLGTAIENVRNEETAAAGAVPEQVSGERRASEMRQPKGTEGLVRKAVDLSRYMDNLTEKQRLAFSLKFEYRLGLTEIASRMGLNRKTAYGHIEAAQRKIDQTHSNEKHRAQIKNTPE
jgi:hypothetical protein